MLVVGASCGGGGAERKLSAPVPTRAAAGLPTATPTTTTPAGSPRKSQPYWVPVTGFNGTGNTTTTAFTIDQAALQWRATWRCEKPPMTVVGVRPSGEELSRKVVDTKTCPDDGTSFSTERGPFTLRVTAGGPWKVDVEQQLESPLVEPPPPGIESAKPLGTARFYNVDRDGEGTARILQLPDGSRLIRLEDFYVSINSELELRLSELPVPKSTPDIAKAPFAEVAMLKATVGSMNYTIPPDVDLAKYRSVVIWCEVTRNAYAAASITPP
jgi:hypothetical protein